MFHYPLQYFPFCIRDATPEDRIGESFRQVGMTVEEAVYHYWFARQYRIEGNFSFTNSPPFIPWDFSFVRFVGRVVEIGDEFPPGDRVCGGYTSLPTENNDGTPSSADFFALVFMDIAFDYNSPTIPQDPETGLLYPRIEIAIGGIPLNATNDSDLPVDAPIECTVFGHTVLMYTSEGVELEPGFIEITVEDSFDPSAL